MFLFQVDPCCYPFRFLSKMPTLLKELRPNLRSNLHSDLLIKPNGYEIRCSDKSKFTSESDWLRKINDFMIKFENNLITRILINIDKSIETEFTRHKDKIMPVDSSDLKIELKDPPDAFVLIEGLRNMVEAEKAKVNIVLEELKNNLDKKSYEFKVVVAYHLELLEMANFAEYCRQKISPDLTVQFRSETKSVVLTGGKHNVEIAEKRMYESLKNNIHECSFEFEKELIRYFFENSLLFKKTLRDNGLKCVLIESLQEESSESRLARLIIKSLHSMQEIGRASCRERV